MNKTTIAEHFSKAISTYPREANIQRQIADKMIHLLQKHVPSPYPRMIEFGCETGIHSRMSLRTLHSGELLLNDLCPEMRCYCEDSLREEQISFLSGDAGTIPFPDKSTSITSCFALQWFELPKESFKRCNTSLHSRGYFAFSTFGKENMKEIRELTGKELPYRPKKEPEAALSFHSDILCSEEELVPLSFEDPVKALCRLKQTGVNGLPAQSSLYPKHKKQTWTHRDLQHFCERHTQKFTQGTPMSLAYHPIYIIARKREV